MIEKIAQALQVEPFELFIKLNTIYTAKNTKKDKFIYKLIDFIEKEINF